MRLLFLIPDLDHSKLFQLKLRLGQTRLRKLARLLGPDRVRSDRVFGGTLNLMRHCATARSIGADAYLTSQLGVDTYGQKWGIGSLPFIRWDERRSDDICIVPDFCSFLIDRVVGPCVSYQQSPVQIRTNFNYRRENVYIWTDSLFMLELCQKAFPGKDIPIVPNIVDNKAFPFVPQPQRTQGELMAFPRKGPEFIEATYKAYKKLGGTYWNLTMIDGLPFNELALRFRTPQAFLASADVEGCALPPQEAMAAGIVVIGKDARGANFSMEDGETALIANSPEEAAKALVRAEDQDLRERLAAAAHHAISCYFPEGEPAAFYARFLTDVNERHSNSAAAA